MTIATGTNKKVSLKLETVTGTAAGAAGAQELPRTEATITLSKDTYESQQKVSHGQVSDMRHGVRRVGGPINGELAPGIYSLPMQSIFRRNFTAGATSGALVTVTAAATAPGTFTRSAGSWFTDGFKVGDVVRFSGWVVATANNARNYRITALTATVMTVGTTATGAVGATEAVVARAAGDSVTATVTGKKTFMPIAGMTSDSYTIEEWFSDIAQSELFVGCQFSSMAVRCPATGYATVQFTVVGRNITTGTAEYFSSPTVPLSIAGVAAVNGSLRTNGADVAIVTAIEFTIDYGLSGEPVVGSNFVPQLFYGRGRVSGSYSAFFENGTMRDLFVNETESSVNLVMTTGNEVNADFIAFTMSRIKVGAADKNDVDLGITRTFPFTALLDDNGGAGTATEATTISVQDSAA